MKKPKPSVVEDNIIFIHIQRAAPDLILENTYRLTGPEAMTEKEKAAYVMKKYGSRHDKNRNTIKSKP